MAHPPAVMRSSPFLMGLSEENFGPSARQFDPSRWLVRGEDSADHGTVRAEPTARVMDAAKANRAAPNGTANGAACNVVANGAAHDVADEPTGAAKAPPAAAMPFSWGPRDCIGQALARLELQVMLAVLVGRYRLAPALDLLQDGPEYWKDTSADPDSIVPLRRRAVYNITMGTKHGLPLLLTPRA